MCNTENATNIIVPVSVNLYLLLSIWIIPAEHLTMPNTQHVRFFRLAIVWMGLPQQVEREKGNEMNNNTMFGFTWNMHLMVVINGNLLVFIGRTISWWCCCCCCLTHSRVLASSIETVARQKVKVSFYRLMQCA